MNLAGGLKTVSSWYRVRTTHGKPGKSWNVIISVSSLEKSKNLSVGHGKSWKMTENYFSEMLLGPGVDLYSRNDLECFYFWVDVSSWRVFLSLIISVR